MLPYLCTLSFVMFWILLEQKTLKRKSFLLPLALLSLFAGVRSYHVGTDSVQYVKNFINPIDISSYKFNENLEIGYSILSYTLLKLTNNYFWLFIVTSLIVVYCHLKIIRKYSVDYSLSVFLFFTLGAYTFFFNILRQGLAISIFLIAIPFLLQKKLVPYFLVVFAASLFHSSALIMIPFYFLVNLNLKLVYKVLISLLASLFSTKVILSYLISSNPRYRFYDKDYDASSGILTLAFYVSVFFILYIYDYYHKIQDSLFKKLFVLYSTGVFFIIPIALLGTNPSGPQRLIYYFTWPLILLIPIVLKKSGNLFIYFFAIIFALIYFILTTSRFGNLTPYILNPVFEIL